ncbi:uncharacterized protein LOC142497436 [Ascaphus truei]|uniref:uncharacterized protein LOC142497436 n=1 Tax=Ascaphus truei TaxID=8439 RepID=UPI003F5A3E36
MEVDREERCYLKTEIRSMRDASEELNSRFETINQMSKNFSVQASEGDKRLHESEEENRLLIEEKSRMQLALEKAEGDWEKEKYQLENDRLILSSKLEKAYADSAQYQTFMAQVDAALEASQKEVHRLTTELEASKEKSCHFNTEQCSLREIFEVLNISFETVTQECKNLYVQVSEGDKKLHKLGEEKKQLAQEKLDVQTALQNAERVLQEERVSLERRTQAENMLQSQLRELRTHLQDTKEKWVNAEEKQRVLQEENFQTAYKIKMLQDYLSTQCVPKEQHEELKATLSITRASLEEELKLAAEHTSQQLTALQAQNAELKTQLAKKEEREKVSVCQVAGLTQRYEVKMADACKLLDHTARDKVRLQLSWTMPGRSTGSCRSEMKKI